jgi:hypothetical protein
MRCLKSGSGSTAVYTTVTWRSFYVSCPKINQLCNKKLFTESVTGTTKHEGAGDEPAFFVCVTYAPYKPCKERKNVEGSIYGRRPG